MLNTDKLVEGYEAYEYLRNNDDYRYRKTESTPTGNWSDIVAAYNESKEVNVYE